LDIHEVCTQAILNIQRLMQEDFNIYFAATLAIANYPAKGHLCFVDILDLLHVKPMLAYLFWLSAYPFYGQTNAKSVQYL